MEAGKIQEREITRSVDLVTAMVSAADPAVSDSGGGGDGALRMPYLRVLLRHVHR